MGAVDVAANPAIVGAVTGTEFPGVDVADKPFLSREDVAKLGGVAPETVSRYLTRSRPGQQYASDPFPAPDGHNGRWPWWALGREAEIREWFARRADRSGVGGRPPKVK